MHVHHLRDLVPSVVPFDHTLMRTTMHYNYNIRILLLAALLCWFGAPIASAQTVGSCEPAIGEAYLDINNVRARIMNNGNLFWRGNPNVYEIPKGGGISTNFASGIWMGGQVNGQLRLAGSTYGPYEFWAGPLDDAGAPPADCSIFDRVWKISKEDVVAYEGSGLATPDLQDWPTGLGAPTLDANGDEIDLTDQPLSSRQDRTINLAAGERPAILGDQMLWWIMNDRGNQHNRTQTPAMGVEVHGSAFAFNTAGAIGSTTFYKYRIMYKGDVPLEDTYMGIFDDPDLGAAFDDYVGSDTTLGMGYVYNADNDDDGYYGPAPPAMGYDFFQGPLVNDNGKDDDGDGTVDEEDERLKMTSFTFYNNDGGVTGDPGNGADMYNYMSGRWKDGQRISLGGNGRDFSNIPTSFMFPGEPGEFWSELNSDGDNSPIEPADRRFVMATGPFTIRPNDEQTLVFGIVTSFGEDNIDSVRKMKADDELAQAVFDIDFALPSPPAGPRVTTTVDNGSVLIEWGYIPTDNNYLNSYSVVDPLLSSDVTDNDYVFEGYNVYRFANASDQEGELIAVYDVPNGVTRVIEGNELTFLTADGSDSGVQTYHKVSGLTNYRDYEFGVQAYAYNATSGQKVYPGPVSRFRVTPAITDVVVNEEAQVLETSADADFTMDLPDEDPRKVSKSGIGGGMVAAKVVNAANLRDASYAVSFKSIADPNPDDGHKRSLALEEDEVSKGTEIGGKAASDDITVYDVSRDGTLIFDGAEAAASIGGAPPQGSDLFVVDGLSMTISGPPKEYLGWDERAGPGSDEVIDGELFHSLNNGDKRAAGDVAWYGEVQGGTEDRLDWQGGLAAAAPQEVEIRFVENPEVNGQVMMTWSGPSDCGYYMCGWVEGQDRLFDDPDTGTYTEVVRGNGRLPFQVWLIDPVAGTETQIMASILDEGDTARGLWEPCGRSDASFGNGCSYERIYTNYIPYDEAAILALTDGASRDALQGGGWGPGRIMFAPYFDSYRDGNTGGYFAAPPSPGTVVRFTTSKPNLPGDLFTFSTDGYGKRDRTEAENRAAIEDIGITPNPYKGASAYEVSQLTDQVRFTNMPNQATVRVFTVAGTLVRSMEKNSASASFPWDLTTDEGLPLASGMYIIHVETDLGEKVIKFGVVKKRVQLNTF